MFFDAKKLSLISAAIAISTFDSAQAASYINNSKGKYCREYTESFNIGGREETGYGTACLQPDGSWEKQSYDDGKYSDKVKQNTVYIIEKEPVYIRPYRYSSHNRYYRQPANFFSLSFGNNNRAHYSRPDYRYKSYKRYSRYDNRRWRH